MKDILTDETGRTFAKKILIIDPRGTIKIKYDFQKYTRVVFQHGKRVDFIKYEAGPYLKRDYTTTLSDLKEYNPNTITTKNI